MTEKEVKPSPEPTIVLRGHAGDVQCLAFCRSTRRLFSGCVHGYVRLLALGFEQRKARSSALQ